MSAFNRLHFYKTFDINKEFIVIKNFETSGIRYTLGMKFDKTSMPKHKVKAMFNARKIAYAESMNNPAEIVSVLDDDFVTVDLVPEIKKGAFGWLTVTVNGEQIGSKTKDSNEAQRIIDEWLSTK